MKLLYHSWRKKARAAKKVDNILTTEPPPKYAKMRTNLHFWPRYQKREKPLKTLIKSTFSRAFSLAEKERFELSNRFWRLHDFQSCALDQLGDFSKYSIVARRLIYHTTSVSVCQYLFSLFLCFFIDFQTAKMPQRPRGWKGTLPSASAATARHPLDFHSIYKAGSIHCAIFLWGFMLSIWIIP